MVSAGPYAGLGGTIVSLGTRGGNLRLDKDVGMGKGKGKRSKEVMIAGMDF